MQTLQEMEKEVSLLEQHVKTYHVGYFPIFYFTKNYGTSASPMFVMRLSDFFEENPGQNIPVKVKERVTIGKRALTLQNSDRLMLTWYLLQRVPVLGVTKDCLQQLMCVNRDNNMVQAPAYRKALERASAELQLSHTYNTAYLKAIYAYREIASGKITIEGMAGLYHCSRLHLLRHILKSFPEYYDEAIIKAVAGVTDTEQEVKFL